MEGGLLGREVPAKAPLLRLRVGGGLTLVREGLEEAAPRISSVNVGDF
jgi:hypothetical protein